MTEPSLMMPADDCTVVIPSRLFGPLTVSSSQLLDFPTGLLGFAGQHQFVLLPASADGVFWLQSASEGNLAFLVVDPFAFCPEYEIDLSSRIDIPFPADEFDDLIVMAMVTLPRQPTAPPTMNLGAPLLINMEARRAFQITTGEPGHSPQHAFSLPHQP